MSQQKMNLLLIEDVLDLGKSGDLVKVKPGFARNFLLPKKNAIIADKQTLKMQKKLQEERSKGAFEDRSSSEELAKRLEVITLKKEVKVDPVGQMYGSVSSQEVVALLEKENVQIDKKWVNLPRSIKETGTHKIEIILKEGVSGFVILKIIPEGVIEADIDQVVLPIEQDILEEEDLTPTKASQKLSKEEKKEIKKATKKI